MTAGYRIRELLTAKILPMPEEGYGKGGRRVLKYTKHYYASTSLSTGIGSERIASYLGTRQSVGLYCDQETTLIAPLDAKVLEAGQALEDLFAHFDKTIDLDTPYLYGNSRNFVCDPTQLTEAFGAYWYHPDHLGSSSYITNLAGEINQHMEYLPFGELLVEEHLNSYNSPFKFNAKEFDAETGNYYYGARYYSPKYNLMLSVDQMYDLYPSFSPYAYTLQNPVRYVDPTGMTAEDYDDRYKLLDNGKIEYYDSKGGDKVDYLIDSDGNEIELNDTTILPQLESQSIQEAAYYDKNVTLTGSYAESDNHSEMRTLYDWIASRNENEWSYVKGKN